MPIIGLDATHLADTIMPSLPSKGSVFVQAVCNYVLSRYLCVVLSLFTVAGSIYGIATITPVVKCNYIVRVTR